MTLCLHCKTRKCNRPRGLCESCYARPSIRRRYAMIPTEPKRIANEPTMEELEKTIAEQRPTMPARIVGEE